MSVNHGYGRVSLQDQREAACLSEPMNQGWLSQSHQKRLSNGRAQALHNRDLLADKDLGILNLSRAAKFDTLAHRFHGINDVRQRRRRRSPDP